MTDASEVSLGGETIKSVLAKFTMALTGFIGTVIFARLLGPTDFGGFYLLFAVVKVIDRPIGGFGNAAKKRFSESKTNSAEVLGGQLIASTLGIVLGTILVLVFESKLRSFTGLEKAPWLFVILLATVSFYEPLERLLQARGRVGAASWMDTLRSYLTLPLQLAFVLGGFGAAGMVYGLTVATMLTLPIAIRYIRVRPALPSPETLDSLWSFARHSIVNALIGKAYDRFDILLLGALIAPAAAGQYEVAAKLTIPATFVAAAASEGLMARVSNLRSKGDKFVLDISNTLAFASILSLPLFFGALALSRSLVVTIYGAEYHAAATLLVGLAAYRVVQTQSAPLIQSLAGLDRPDLNRNVSITSLMVNIVLGVILTVQMGPVGVVIATVIAESIRYAVLAYYLRKLTPDVNLFPRTLLEQFGAATAMFIIVVGLHQMVPVRSWIHLSALVSAGAAVYGFVLLTSSRRLRTTIGSVLRGSRIERFVPEPLLQW